MAGTSYDSSVPGAPFPPGAEWAPSTPWAPPGANSRRRRRGKRWIAILLGVFVLAFAGCAALALSNRSVRETATAFAHGANKMYWAASSAMEPSIRAGDKVAATTHIGRIHRGDVLILKSKQPGVEVIIKRVVGLPGETITAAFGAVSVNGRPLDEPYARGLTRGVTRTVLAADSYYVLGDNRTMSRDSRFDGPFTRAEVVAVVLRIVSPSSHAGRIPGSTRS
jgi:signal peptidase I